MIHAYAFIWRCLLHDIIIEIREKACVHVHHLEISTQEKWKWKQLSVIIQPLNREYTSMNGEEGVWGRQPPEANRMKRSQIKWKLLLFDESDFFFY